MRFSELPSNGLERFTTESVRFHQQFNLGKAPEVYPAGVYQVETKTQPIEAGGHTVLVRTSTVLVVPTANGSFCREVRGSELDYAISCDREKRGETEPSENPDRGDAGTSRRLP